MKCEVFRAHLWSAVVTWSQAGSWCDVLPSQPLAAQCQQKKDDNGVRMDEGGKCQGTESKLDWEASDTQTR